MIGSLASEHFLLVLTNIILSACSCLEWCKVYCQEDAKTHIVSTRSLEAEDSDTLTSIHLVTGNTLIWKLKGKKYTTTLLQVHGTSSFFLTKQLRHTFFRF